MAFSMLKAKHMFMHSAKTKASKSVVRMQSKAFYPKPHFCVIRVDAATIVSNSFQDTLSIYEGTDGALFGF